MGRRRIDIKRITSERSRQITFVKRKHGLMKKAYELSVLCDCKVALVVISPNMKLYEYSSIDMDTILTEAKNFPGFRDTKTNLNFQNPKKKKEAEDSEEYDEEDEIDLQSLNAESEGEDEEEVYMAQTEKQRGPVKTQRKASQQPAAKSKNNSKKAIAAAANTTARMNALKKQQQQQQLLQQHLQQQQQLKARKSQSLSINTNTIPTKIVAKPTTATVTAAVAATTTSTARLFDSLSKPGKNLKKPSLRVVIPPDSSSNSELIPPPPPGPYQQSQPIVLPTASDANTSSNPTPGTLLPSEASAASSSPSVSASSISSPSSAGLSNHPTSLTSVSNFNGEILPTWNIKYHTAYPLETKFPDSTFPLSPLLPFPNSASLFKPTSTLSPPIRSSSLSLNSPGVSLLPNGFLTNAMMYSPQVYLDSSYQEVQQYQDPSTTSAEFNDNKRKLDPATGELNQNQINLKKLKV